MGVSSYQESAGQATGQPEIFARDCGTSVNALFKLSLLALQLYSSPKSNYKFHIFRIRCQLFQFFLLFHSVSPFHTRRLGLKSSTLKLIFHMRAFKRLCVRGPFPWQQDEIRLWLCRPLDWEKHLKISLLTVKMGWPGEQKHTKKKSRASEIQCKSLDMTSACISILGLLVFFFFWLNDNFFYW